MIDPSGQVGPDYWTYYAERLAQLTANPTNATLLDIGTYDGNVLFKAMNNSEADYGVGLDIDSDGFPAGVAEAIQRGWHKKVHFVQMDAKALGFLPQIFHGVLANFIGWDDIFDFERMAFIRPDNIMPEIMRVLKPGGQVAIGSWVAQSDIDWFINTCQKYHPLYEGEVSCYSRENPEGQKVILHQAGFQDIRLHVEKTNFVSPDADTWWRQMQQAAYGCFRKIPDPAQLDVFRVQVFEDLHQHYSPEGIRFSKTVSFAIGAKPG